MDVEETIGLTSIEALEVVNDSPNGITDDEKVEDKVDNVDGEAVEKLNIGDDEAGSIENAEELDSFSPGLLLVATSNCATFPGKAEAVADRKSVV